MLGTFGFFVAAIAFLAYGFSSYGLASTKHNFSRTNFLIAYILIATACLTWGVGVQLDIQQLKTAIYTGDALLLAACVFLLATTVKKSQQLSVFILGVLTAGVLLFIRINTSVQDAFVRDGILIFNTPRIFGAILAVILLTVWVKANMNFFTTVIDKNIQSALRPNYFAANMVAYIGVIGFLLARKNITISVSFAMIVLAFFCLVALNGYAKKPDSIKVATHAK